MIKGKEAYLKKLTANMYIPSLEVGTDLDGSTPPSVFIGSWNYPKVYAGPMISPLHGDTIIMDRPESWIPEKKTQEEIIRYRLNLIRGKKTVKVTHLESRFIDKLRDISLSSSSIESEVQFHHAPKGMSFSDEHTPFGPSAPLERLEIDNARWDQNLEKVYFDGDLLAADAVVDLHQKGLPFSSIQKAFSMGTMGTKKRRRLVPTRWSITACDSTLANRLLQKVREYDVIDCCQVREFSSLNNYYAVLLLPTSWQYEWMEAFLHILGNEELIFSDYENNGGKKSYSRVGGCYYSCKMAVLEALAREKKQAGAIILREAYSGYVPLGVFNVRENVRNAMQDRALPFEDMKSAALRCFGWLTSSYHEMEFGAVIKKSASRIAKHSVRMGWVGIQEDFYFLSYPLEIARNQKCFVAYLQQAAVTFKKVHPAKRPSQGATQEPTDYIELFFLTFGALIVSPKSHGDLTLNLGAIIEL